MPVSSRSYYYLLLLALMWGSSFALIKVMVETIPPVAGTSIRLVLAALFLYALLRITGGRLPRSAKVWLILFIIGLTGSGVPFTLLAFGGERIPSGSSAILMATVPLFTVLLARATFGDEPLSMAKVAGVLMGLIGVGFLFGPDALLGIATSIWGFAAVLVAAFLYGVTNILAKTLKPISPLSSGTAAFICSGAVSVPFAFWLDNPFEILANGVSMESFVSLILLVIFPSALANVLFFRLISMSGPTFVSLNNYLVPLVGIGWGVGLLGEAATWNSIAALALIFAGIAVTNIGANRRVAVEAAD